MAAVRHGAAASAAVAVVACSPSSSGLAGPTPDLDAAHFGHPDSVLFWGPDQQLAGFRNYERIFPTRTVPASPDPFPLPVDSRDLSGIRYEVDGEAFDLAAFREHNRVAGLLVIKKGVVVYEAYSLGNDSRTKWVSYSVAKSVVSMLIGAAIQEGYIRSIDDPVSDYVPVLRGGAYDGVSIRHLLHMSSGVAWNEDYTDPTADVSVVIPFTALERLKYLSGLPRSAPAGQRFNYSTGETELAGAVVRGAVGNNLAAYLEAKIWAPFGMEADANWMLVEPEGAEQGGCCISATLRDYGRIGMFALRGGVLRDGTPVLPADWMEESLTPAPTNEGYGYLWWLGDGDVYSARGIFGQAILIDPDEELIVVTHSVWPTPTSRDLSAHRDAVFRAIREALRS